MIERDVDMIQSNQKSTGSVSVHRHCPIASLMEFTLEKGHFCVLFHMYFGDCYQSHYRHWVHLNGYDSKEEEPGNILQSCIRVVDATFLHSGVLVSKRKRKH